jgi:hypothetical protein
MDLQQSRTGQLTEERVRLKLEAFGLIVRKPVPDKGVDLEAWLPSDPSRIVRIQVKGRNPKKVTSHRWFQIRVSKAQLAAARTAGEAPEEAWRQKLSKADFLLLDSVTADETWVFSIPSALELIRLNEQKYAKRPDNVFSYNEPLKGKQKEMNLDIVVGCIPLTEYFKDCLDNFDSIMMFLRMQGSQY